MWPEEQELQLGGAGGSPPHHLFSAWLNAGLSIMGFLKMNTSVTECELSV